MVFSWLTDFLFYSGFDVPVTVYCGSFLSNFGFLNTNAKIMFSLFILLIFS